MIKKQVLTTIAVLAVACAANAVNGPTELFAGLTNGVVYVTYTNTASGPTSGLDYAAGPFYDFGGIYPVVGMVSDGNYGIHAMQTNGLAHFGWDGSGITAASGFVGFPGGTAVDRRKSDGAVFSTQVLGLNAWSHDGGTNYSEYGFWGFPDARDVAVDASGVIHAVHSGGISAFTLIGGTLAAIDGAFFGLGNARSIEIDAAGNIYIGRDEGINILTFDGSIYTLDTREIGWWGATCADLAISSDGTIFSARTNGGEMDAVVYDAVTGFTQTGFLGGLGGIDIGLNPSFTYTNINLFVDSEDNIHLGKFDGILEINYDDTQPIVGSLAVGDFGFFSGGVWSMAESAADGPLPPPPAPVVWIDAANLYWTSTNGVLYSVSNKTDLVAGSWAEWTNGIAATPNTNSIPLPTDTYNPAFFKVNAYR